MITPFGLPPSLEPVWRKLIFLTGEPELWPTAREDIARHVMRTHQQQARFLRDRITDLDAAVNALSAVYRGRGRDQILLSYQRDLRLRLDQQARAHEALAEAHYRFALDVEHRKGDISLGLIGVGFTLTLLGVLILLGKLPGAIAKQVASASATRIKIILAMSLGVVFSGLSEVGLEFGLQTYEYAKGSRREMDWEAVRDSFRAALLPGAVGGAGGLGALLLARAMPKALALPVFLLAQPLVGAATTATEAVQSGERISLRLLVSGALNGMLGTFAGAAGDAVGSRVGSTASAGKVELPPSVREKIERGEFPIRIADISLAERKHLSESAGTAHAEERTTDRGQTTHKTIVPTLRPAHRDTDLSARVSFKQVLDPSRTENTQLNSSDISAKIPATVGADSNAEKLNIASVVQATGKFELAEHYPFNQNAHASQPHTVTAHDGNFSGGRPTHPQNDGHSRMAFPGERGPEYSMARNSHRDLPDMGPLPGPHVGGSNPPGNSGASSNDADSSGSSEFAAMDPVIAKVRTLVDEHIKNYDQMVAEMTEDSRAQWRESKKDFRNYVEKKFIKGKDPTKSDSTFQHFRNRCNETNEPDILAEVGSRICSLMGIKYEALSLPHEFDNRRDLDVDPIEEEQERLSQAARLQDKERRAEEARERNPQYVDIDEERFQEAFGTDEVPIRETTDELVRDLKCAYEQFDSWKITRALLELNDVTKFTEHSDGTLSFPKLGAIRSQIADPGLLRHVGLVLNTLGVPTQHAMTEKPDADFRNEFPKEELNEIYEAQRKRDRGKALELTTRLVRKYGLEWRENHHDFRQYANDKSNPVKSDTLAAIDSVRLTFLPRWKAESLTEIDTGDPDGDDFETPAPRAIRVRDGLIEKVGGAVNRTVDRTVENLEQRGRRAADGGDNDSSSPKDPDSRERPASSAIDHDRSGDTDAIKGSPADHSSFIPDSASPGSPDFPGVSGAPPISGAGARPGMAAGTDDTFPSTHSGDKTSGRRFNDGKITPDVPGTGPDSGSGERGGTSPGDRRPDTGGPDVPVKPGGTGPASARPDLPITRKNDWKAPLQRLGNAMRPKNIGSEEFAVPLTRQERERRNRRRANPQAEARREAVQKRAGANNTKATSGGDDSPIQAHAAGSTTPSSDAVSERSANSNPVKDFLKTTGLTDTKRKAAFREKQTLGERVHAESETIRYALDEDYVLPPLLSDSSLDKVAKLLHQPELGDTGSNAEDLSKAISRLHDVVRYNQDPVAYVENLAAKFDMTPEEFMNQLE